MLKWMSAKMEMDGSDSRRGGPLLPPGRGAASLWAATQGPGLKWEKQSR